MDRMTKQVAHYKIVTEEVVEENYKCILGSLKCCIQPPTIKIMYYISDDEKFNDLEGKD